MAYIGMRIYKGIETIYQNIPHKFSIIEFIFHYENQVYMRVFFCEIFKRIFTALFLIKYQFVHLKLLQNFVFFLVALT